MNRLKWLYPGMRFKRWLLFCALGIIFILIGLCDRVAYDKNYLLVNYPYIFFDNFDFIMVTVGFGFIVLGIQKSFKSIMNVVVPEKEHEVVDMIYKKRQLEKGPRIVAIGGGTGLPVVLQGIKEISSNITAIVTVADDGGSSGRLRKDFKVLPPGDIRNCLVALADQEHLMSDIFQYRFSDQSEDLGGHNFGNLFITAMSEVTGDFAEAIRQSSKVLAIRGQVVPSTLENVNLVAELENGKLVEGESKISKTLHKIKHVTLQPKDCKPNPECLKAIEEAEVIIFSPGSLYTSLLPNLIINDVTKAISKSSALKIYICNIMTQIGETDNYSTEDHVKVIFNHTQKGLFKYILINDTIIPADILKRYKDEKSEIVTTNAEELRNIGVKIIKDDLLLNGNLVRHDPKKLTKAILSFLIENNIRQTDVYVKRHLKVDLLENEKLDNVGIKVSNRSFKSKGLSKEMVI